MYKAAFDKFDQDKSGSIDGSELSSLFASLGWDDPDGTLVDRALKLLDKDVSSVIEFDEFLKFAEFSWKYVATSLTKSFEPIFGNAKAKSISKLNKSDDLRHKSISILQPLEETTFERNNSNELQESVKFVKSPQKKNNLLTPIISNEVLPSKINTLNNPRLEEDIPKNKKIGKTRNLASLEPHQLKRPLPHSKEAIKRARHARQLAIEKKYGKKMSKKEMKKRHEEAEIMLAPVYSVQGGYCYYYF